MTGSPAPITECDRAAIMLMVMDEDQASDVLSRFNPDELRRLGERMCALGEVGPEAITQAIATFVARTEQVGLSAHDRVGQVRSIMSRAVGEAMKRSVVPEGPVAALELARWLSADKLLPLIADEHPQVIAVLLVQLDAEIAAQILQGLPAPMQPQVIHRIARLGPVTAEAVAMLDSILNQRMTSLGAVNAESIGMLDAALGPQASGGPVALGGPKEAADIINKAHRSVEQQVMPALTKLDKKLALLIEQEMVKFDHLYALDEKAVGAVLRDVDSETLITALKGITPDQREFFLSAMSTRAADGVRDELELRGRIRREEVDEAQREIIVIVRRLAAAGEIAFGPADDEYV